MSKDIKPLNFKKLVPMYETTDMIELEETASRYGVNALTKDEKLFAKSYTRLNAYLNKLSTASYKQLVKAIETNQEDLIKRHVDAEYEIYKEEQTKLPKKNDKKKSYMADEFTDVFGEFDENLFENKRPCLDDDYNELE